MDTSPTPPPHDRRGESQEEEGAPESEPLCPGTGHCWARQETNSGALSKRKKKKKVKVPQLDRLRVAEFRKVKVSNSLKRANFKRGN